MLKRGKRAAFTMIELVMVIVILGVVSMIATDIISRMYQGYINSQIVNELQQKTELTLNQIAKRLQYRVKETVVAKNSLNPNIFKKLDSNDNRNFDMIEWISYDNEGFLGEWNGTIFTPGWSSFVDLNDTVNTNIAQISTPGSRLDFANRTILALSYGEVGLTTATQEPVIIFKELSGDSPRSFGFDPGFALNDHNNTLRVNMPGGAIDILAFSEPAVALSPKIIYEQYRLAWSAYAIVPEPSPNVDDFNLTLRYNYQPWYDERFHNTPNTRSSLIAENVSTFRVTQTGQTVTVKLCIHDGNRTGTPIGFCKERSIY